MRIKSCLLILSLILVTACSKKTSTEEVAGPIDQISLNSVAITDSFWNLRIENNYRVSVMNMLETYEKNGEYPNPKLIEAAGYILQMNDDPELQSRMDKGIEKLLVYVLPEGKPRKWNNLLNGEMYTAGHLMEAAVEYYKATGNQAIMDAAILLADDIDKNFGPGKRRDISQHEEIKIGLLKLYHFTGDEKYMKLAKFFMDERGHSHNGRELYGEYAQDHMPVIEQQKVVGHTVRATYLYTPLAELAVLTNDPDYIAASDRLWEDAVYKKTYLTGNIGTYRDHEDFGDDYELPNVSCWNETCASIGNFFWNHQLFSLHRDAKYADMMERILYNGILVGVSLDGSEYFYQNPLKSFGGFERHDWFGPNCCPPNVARLFASLGKYIYASDSNKLYVNLFIGSSISTEFNGNPVLISQASNYPWEGDVKISVEPEMQTEFTLFVRIPGWTGATPLPGDLYHYTDEQLNNVELSLNGKKQKMVIDKGFAKIKRTWKKGDIVELAIPMNVRKVAANDMLLDDTGLIALERGPLVYCAEAIDNMGLVLNKYLPANAEITEHFEAELLGGVVELSADANVVTRGDDGISKITQESSLNAIPYFAWANRGPGEMSVWLASDESKVLIPPVPTIASGSSVSSSCGNGSIEDNYPGGDVPEIAKRFYPRSQSGSAGFEALYDQVIPVNSFDGSSKYLSLRPQSGNTAWVEYNFARPERISASDIYWKDDKQYCQVPESWQLLYRSEGKWIPVNNSTGYTVEKDKFNSLAFDPITTDGLRLEITLRGLDFKKGELGPPDGNYMPADTSWFETGIIEWQVSGQ